MPDLPDLPTTSPASVPSGTGEGPLPAQQGSPGSGHPSASPANTVATGDGLPPPTGQLSGGSHLSTASPGSTNLAAGEGPPDRTYVPGPAVALPKRGPERWTPKRDADLRTLWPHRTTPKIAQIMHTTKNAIIGRAHRLGLSGAYQSKPKAPKHAQPHGWKVLKAEPKAKPSKPNPPKLAAAKRRKTSPCTLVDFTNRTCRYPLGELQEPPRFFCGVAEADMAAGVAYCREHRAICYQQPRR